MRKKNDLKVFGIIILISIIVAVIASLIYNGIQNKRCETMVYPWETEDAVVLSDDTIDCEVAGSLKSLALDKIVMADGVLYFVGEIEGPQSVSALAQVLINDSIYFPVSYSFDTYGTSNDISKYMYSFSLARRYFDYADIDHIDNIVLHIDDVGDGKYENIRIAEVNLPLPENVIKVDKHLTQMTEASNFNYCAFFCGSEMSKYNCNVYFLYKGNDTEEYVVDTPSICLNNVLEYACYGGGKYENVEYYPGATYFQEIMTPMSDMLRENNLPIRELAIQSGNDIMVFQRLNIQ